MWETNSYETHKDHMILYEALEKSMNRNHTNELLKDLAEARKKKKNRRDSPKTSRGSPHRQLPPPLPPAGPSKNLGSPGASGSSEVPPPPLPPLSTNQEGQSHGSTAPSSLKTAALAEYKAWTMTNTRIRSSISSTPEDLHVDDDIAPDAQAHSSDDEDIGNAYISTAVRTHMRILSVVRIKVFSMYGYDYMKKIVFRRADLNEHINAKRDFKYLYLSDIEDLYLLNLQGHQNHLPPKDKKIFTTAVNLWTRHLVIRQHVEDFQLGIQSYQTQVNLTKPRWDATSFEYKHDYTVIDSPRVVTFRDKYGVQMIMWFNEIHKFCDGTLHQIDEALDYRVKEFKANRMSPGLNTMF
nr:hypothetical protein [Tanacetum cinerariifolium]